MPKSKTAQQGREIPNHKDIKLFMHCSQCLSEKPAGVSPRDWGQLEIGWTDIGLQVWCRRHEANVAHIDFEGQSHPANLTRPRQVGHD